MDVGTLKDLIRAPAVLSAPGDALVGASSNSELNMVRTLGLSLSSALLYAGGMALNDHADRAVDAVERPQRPIPSGRISANVALAVGEALIASGIATAALTHGRKTAVKALLVAAAVHNYNYVAKNAGGDVAAASMAACRVADVSLGAKSVRSSLPALAAVGSHTFVITKVSQGEVDGGKAASSKAATCVASVIAAVEIVAAARSARKAPARFLATTVGAGVYLLPFVKAARTAAENPTPENNGKVVGTGVKAMIPLQGSLVAAHGRPVEGAAITALWPIARKFGRKRSVT